LTAGARVVLILGLGVAVALARAKRRREAEEHQASSWCVGCPLCASACRSSRLA